MSIYKRITASDLVVGKPLPFDVLDVDGRLLLREGYIVDSQMQVDRLVDIGLFRAQRREELDEKNPEPAKLSPFDTISFIQRRLRNAFVDTLNRTLENASDTYQRLSLDLLEIIDGDADAALGAIHLDEENEYSITHPVNCAILSDCIARRLEMSFEERISLSCAALTANISMLTLQDTLNQQKEPLTPDQGSDIWRHPQRSLDMLIEAGIGDVDWLGAVLHHHERMNGTGYPDRLQGEAIPKTARILSLADTYTAMVTPRAYRPEIRAKEALREIFMSRGGEIDETVALIFIKELGIFPPGAFVRLANGETAIVVKRGKDAMHPVVQAVLSPRGGPYSFPKRRQTDEERYQVKEIVSRDKTVTLNLNRLWGYG